MRRNTMSKSRSRSITRRLISTCGHSCIANRLPIRSTGVRSCRPIFPSFPRGLIEADVRTAWSKLRQAAIDESRVRRQVIHDVQTTYENLVTAEQRIRDLTEEVKAPKMPTGRPGMVFGAVYRQISTFSSPRTSFSTHN